MGQVEPDRAGRLRGRRRRRRAGRPPHDPAKVAEVYAAYEQVKRTAGVIDFEDLLRAAVWGDRGAPRRRRPDPRAVPAFRGRRVPGRQPGPAAAAAGLAGRPGRPDRGRRRQPDHLLVHRRHLELPGRLRPRAAAAARRHAGAAGPRLPVHAAGGRRWPTRSSGWPGATRPGCGWSWSASARPGPSRCCAAYPDEPAEAAGVAARCAELIAAGTPAREIAVLFRTNAQSAGVRGGAGRGRRAVRGAGRGAVLRAGRGAPGHGRAAGGDPYRRRHRALRADGGRRAGGGRLAAGRAARPAARPGSGGRRWPRWSGWPRSSATSDGAGRVHRGAGPPGGGAARARRWTG